MLLSILPVTLFSALSAASAIPVRSTGNPALTWHVSNFSTGCSPGGCIYNFNIAGIGTENTPGFNTTCSGNDVQDGYNPCADKHVRAQLNPHTYPEWNLKVKHVWFDEVGEYMSIGQVNITSPADAFKIPVRQQYGVG